MLFLWRQIGQVKFRENRFKEKGKSRKKEKETIWKKKWQNVVNPEKYHFFDKNQKSPLVDCIKNER